MTVGDSAKCCKGNKIYIKPQLVLTLYLTFLCCKGNKIYIKPQPLSFNCTTSCRCKGNKIYIKPQHIKGAFNILDVVKVIKSISNHNNAPE